MTQFRLKRLNFTQKLGASIQTMCTTLVKVTTFLYQRQSTRIDLREVELDWFDDRLANVCQRWSNDLQMAQTCPSFNTQIKLKQDKYLCHWCRFVEPTAPNTSTRILPSFRGKNTICKIRTPGRATIATIWRPIIDSASSNRFRTQQFGGLLIDGFLRKLQRNSSYFFVIALHIVLKLISCVGGRRLSRVKLIIVKM